MSMTVLFAGGPKDGELVAIQDDRVLHPIAVAVTNKSVRAWLEEEPLESAQPTFSTKFYHPVKVALFGKRADRPVYVFEDVDAPAALAAHLLTPLARGLVGL